MADENNVPPIQPGNAKPHGHEAQPSMPEFPSVPPENETEPNESDAASVSRRQLLLTAVGSDEAARAETIDPPVSAQPAMQICSNSEIEFFKTVGRYLYNHNPFYPLSAVFILVGLHSLFHDEHAATHLNEIGFNNAILWAVLAGYALVLSATSIFIIRSGHVWDDARTILLTLVLLLVAMSVNCDKPIVSRIDNASEFLLYGLLFAVLISEGTLRLARVPLSWMVRGPYYVFLALFFLSPVALNYCLHTLGGAHAVKGQEMMLLGVILFPVAAGLATLTLLPAAMRGPGLTRGAAVPWSWPCYPWSLFVVLGVCVILRAYYLTITFHPRHGTDSAFAVYVLVPFLISVAVIVYELGKSVGSKVWQNLAAAAPLALLPFCLPGSPAVDLTGEFLRVYLKSIGSPMQVGCYGLIAYFVYLQLRQGPSWTPVPLIGLTAFSSVVGPQTVDWQSLVPAQSAPLLVAALLSLIQAVRMPRLSFWWFSASTFGAIALAIALWGTPWMNYRGALPIHLWLIALLTIGMLVHDEGATILRGVVAVAVVAFTFGVTIYSTRSRYGLDPMVVMLYITAWLLTYWLLWYRRRLPDLLAAAVMVSFAAVFQVGYAIALLLRNVHNPLGWAMLGSGVLCFAVGLGVSISKMRSRRDLNGQSL